MGAEAMSAAALWAFSLAFYARPGVAPACLACQDGAGADVNILLLLLWRAREGAALTASAIAAVEARAAPWRHEIVAPLRGLRRRIGKTAMPDLHRHLAAAELEAEQLAQAGFFATSAILEEAPARDAATAADAALEAYEQILGRVLPAQAKTALIDALRAYPPDAPR